MNNFKYILTILCLNYYTLQAVDLIDCSIPKGKVPNSTAHKKLNHFFDSHNSHPKEEDSLTHEVIQNLNFDANVTDPSYWDNAVIKVQETLKKKKRRCKLWCFI